MEKRLTMFLACLFLSLGMAMAQTQISGTVVSSEDGLPIIGASVMVDGTKNGTATDMMVSSLCQPLQVLRLPYLTSV